MSIKTFAAKTLAGLLQQKMKHWQTDPVIIQKKVFFRLIQMAKNTQFAKDHHFNDIHGHQNFTEATPIRDYEGFRPYIDCILEGQADVLWPGKPHYLAKTSGTTSGTKYIPLTRQGLNAQLSAARNALLQYVHETGRHNFLGGKMIFLQGNPKLSEKAGIKYGRLSGIVAHHIPKYLYQHRLPGWETNCIEDWEEKIEAIVKETSKEDMRLVSGIPPWVQMYFERLKKRSGKPIGELFPNFSLMVTGGVNYEPYRKSIQNLIGRSVDILQTYPASEGFIAYQDRQKEKGLLLLLDQGIFYEFVPQEELKSKRPRRLSIGEVELGIDYVLILNTNSGLWGYNLGDLVRFVSKDPPRIIITGRVKNFTSAFGEHVIAHDVEEALRYGQKKHPCRITEFTVAPQVKPLEGLPHHEWYIEFENPPEDEKGFALAIDQALCKKNSYYNDLICGNILQRLIIRKVRKDGIRDYMKSIGKLGGQFKLSRLSNDRKIAEELKSYLKK
ncbi:GH3 family domain-containing protein [Bacteroidetes bacterium endosymbiont of Geopemphigus sp.]|uniref:GH3 family domain-containing protein n=1 Tax=Bacteroidetes bacterium endosymbiont of Geopemphigus sp. TaxID=2047937 RepID=UPI000CD156A0|nr:GH3 auxin-responsive promoter family protein [Bacteroidetes bacterium endosymbiont of Geopemphigus sp.]